MDAVLLENEAVGSRKKQKKAGILCELDIEKTYVTMLIEIFAGTFWRIWDLGFSGSSG